MRIHRSNPSSGFVPVELLAILAVLLLLAGIVLPATARLRSQATVAICLNNHRQITLAWANYASAHQDACANNFTISETLNATSSGRFDNWANNIMSWNAASGVESVSVTNETWAARGILQPYANAGIKIYRCPSDNYLSAQQRQRGYRKRVRSISMNHLIGRLSAAQDRTEGRSPVDPAYRQWLKTHEIPNPKATWLTIDEHPDSINDGVFINPLAADSWQDVPGTLHHGATSFSFVDGHVESRKWRSTTSIRPVRTMYAPPPAFDPAGRDDFAWYLERSGFVRF